MLKKCFFAALAACVFLFAAALHFHGRYQAAQAQLAQHSYSAWGALYWLAHEVGNYEDLEELSNSSYAARHNAIVHDGVTPYLTPSFDSNTFGFLSSDVWPFLNLLVQANPDNTITQQSFQLFQDLSVQIEEISAFVIEHANQGMAQKVELIDHNSEVYQEVNEQIASCIDTYLEDIRFLTPRLNYVIENA